MQSTRNTALLSYLPVGERKPDAISNSIGYPPSLSLHLTLYRPRSQPTMKGLPHFSRPCFGRFPIHFAIRYSLFAIHYLLFAAQPLKALAAQKTSGACSAYL